MARELNNRFLPAAAVVALMILTWAAYSPAASGAFLYDDWHNLDGLSGVDDTFSAAQYVFSGHAGPLGRPVSLATFVPQAEHWPDNARPFIEANVLIHAINAALCFVFFSLLVRHRRIGEKEALVAALAAAALWAFLPVLASSTLLIVQRMATLAALFCLAGLVAYLYFRRRIDTHPRGALVGMTASLYVATGLAVLSKENGVLLPTLALVLECTLLSAPRSLSATRWRYWKGLVLGVPTLLVGALLAAELPWSGVTELQRGFSGLDRLLTQAVILWEYLARALVPQPWKLGPFHDDHTVYRSVLDPVALLAAAAWIAAFAAAIVFRRRHAVASFAVLWYLAGHLVESTTVPLNLYFEHRNYLPLMGPAFAMAYYLLGTGHAYVNVARVGFGAYVVVNCGILLIITSMWGKPLVATANWHVNAPESPAALSEFARRQMTDVSPRVGMITLGEYVSARPEHAYLHLPQLTLSCRLDPDRDKSARAAYVLELLPRMAYSSGVGAMFDELLNQVSQTPCEGLSAGDVAGLAAAAYANERYAAAEDQSYHHQLRAKIALRDGNVEQTIVELSQARSLAPNRNVDMMLVTTLVSVGRLSAADDVIRDARENRGGSPVARIADEMMLRDLARYVDAVRDATQGGTPAAD